MKKIAATGFYFVAAALLVRSAEDKAEQLTRHINLGKAFYENPTTQKEAAAEFKKALDLNPDSAREQLNYGLALLRAGDVKQAAEFLLKSRKTNPALPHTYFNLGVIHKKDGEFEKALQEFGEMAKRAPEEPVTHFNLGMLHKLQGAPEKATAEFETAAKLDSTLAAPHFQLYNSYRAAGRMPDAQRELATFNEIKKRMAALGLSEDMDWSYYAELLEEIPAAATAGAPPVEVAFNARPAGSLGAQASGLHTLDANGDGKLDFLLVGASGSALFLNNGAGFTKSAAPAARAANVGDFNNDTLPDLCLAGPEGASLAANKKGSFETRPLVKGSFNHCVFVDFDHDYDLDVLLLGENPKLMRNNGAEPWTEQPFPFVAGNSFDAAVLETGEDNGFDIVMAYMGKPAVLYRDKKMGRYEAVVLPVALEGRLQVEDFNHDSFLDVAAAGADGVQFLENKHGKLEAGPKVPHGAGAGTVWFADFQNRGRMDMLAGAAMHVHKGGFAWETGKVKGVTPALGIAVGEFTGDNLIDAIGVTADGSATLLANATPTRNATLRVAIQGVKNIKLAPDARVEVKAGKHYQKKAYRGLPLVFGIPGLAAVETVRITWPNGLIQNEMNQKAGSYTYKEAQRLSGSCPMIFTWNGEKFEFISDVLGVAPLGAGLGDGNFFPVDHDEYVQIAGRQLRERDGFYEIRVTEELREVSYIDQIQLIAVDHRNSTQIYTNDKFKAPPFPEFKLFGVDRRIEPRSAIDHTGADVRGLIAQRDARYPSNFRRDINGRAERHSLTLDLTGAGDSPVLFLHGWVDWADGSTFVAASQDRPGALAAPSLEVRDAGGRWVTAIADMGMPAGKPKTIAVDLQGVWKSPSREVRIVTSMAVYWDEIFAAANPRDPEVRLTRMAPTRAGLQFRGFSAVKVHPERLQPESFDYDSVRATSMWNPTPGMYTRYGDTLPLLGRIDDRFVVMGAGDELSLRFDARGLPALPAGWTRDFLIFFDGYAKDADANTAYSSSVGPLPFHAMPGYPYPAGQSHPGSGYDKTYNTRPALRLIRPLAKP